MISQRRSAEDEDDLSLFLGSLPLPPAETDEHGRVVPQANPTIARRERLAARTTRHQRRLSVKPPGTTPDDEDEGFSTDGSLPPSDAADYTSATQTLLTKRQNILADVQAREFLSPSDGLGKWFGQWRDRYGETYTGAWGGLGMVGAWEFWARWEFCGWDPVREAKTLDGFKWYEALYAYSRPSAQGEDEEDGDMDGERELGSDGDLVAAMISTAVLPKICRCVEGGGFDPYSRKHIRRMVDMAEEIEASVGRGNLKFEVSTMFFLLPPSRRHSRSNDFYALF